MTTDTARGYTEYDPPPLPFDDEHDPRGYLPEDLRNEIAKHRADYDFGDLVVPDETKHPSPRLPTTTPEKDTLPAASDTTTLDSVPGDSGRPSNFVTDTVRNVYQPSPSITSPTLPQAQPITNVTAYKAQLFREELSNVGYQTERLSRVVDGLLSTFDAKVAVATDSHLAALVCNNCVQSDSIQDVLTAVDNLIEDSNSVDRRLNRLQSRVDTAKSKIRALSKKADTHDTNIDTSDRNLASYMARFDNLRDSLRPQCFQRP